jgi:5-methylcytosine-specific restriction protein A
MQREIALGNKVVKTQVYRKLAQKWGRTEKSYEMRMSNISAVLESHGRAWIAGLKPLSNVGTNVIAVIEKFLNEVDGIRDLSDAAFEIEVSKKVKSKSLDEPLGNANPEKKLVTVTLISRNSDVKAWLLINASGVCENCNKDAPFIASSGIPYLEVHHVKRLADSGPDTICNAVAVCPNCHKALHYSDNRELIIESLYRRISRLVK